MLPTSHIPHQNMQIELLRQATEDPADLMRSLGLEAVMQADVVIAYADPMDNSYRHRPC